MATLVPKVDGNGRVADKFWLDNSHIHGPVPTGEPEQKVQFRIYSSFLGVSNMRTEEHGVPLISIA